MVAHESMTADAFSAKGQTLEITTARGTGGTARYCLGWQLNYQVANCICGWEVVTIGGLSVITDFNPSWTNRQQNDVILSSFFSSRVHIAHVDAWYRRLTRTALIINWITRTPTAGGV
jgi:hypothetical protein